MTHVLACALCDPGSPDYLNSGGQFLADLIMWGGGIVIALAAFGAVLRGLAGLAPKPKRPPRR